MLKVFTDQGCLQALLELVDALEQRLKGVAVALAEEELPVAHGLVVQDNSLAFTVWLDSLDCELCMFGVELEGLLVITNLVVADSNQVE